MKMTGCPMIPDCMEVSHGMRHMALMNLWLSLLFMSPCVQSLGSPLLSYSSCPGNVIQGVIYLVDSQMLLGSKYDLRSMLERHGSGQVPWEGGLCLC